MKIVCGTDSSACASAAVASAAGLARRLGDSLVLARVTDRLADQAALTASLEEVAAPLRAEGIQVETRVTEGSPVDAILELALRERARLVAVGTHGRRAPARWFVGSVAQGLITRADRPVLISRSFPTDRWAGVGPLRILAGIDVSVASDSALRFLGLLRRQTPFDLTALHVLWPPEVVAPRAPSPSESPFKLDSEERAAWEARFSAKAALAAGPGATRVRVEPSFGAIAFALSDIASTEKHDLILIGAHQRRAGDRLLHGSVSSGLLRVAHVPVLVVPERWGSLAERRLRRRSRLHPQPRS